MSLKYSDRRRLAEKIRRLTMDFLYERTNIERIAVLTASTGAAEEHGRVLAMMLEEAGIEVERTPS